MIMFYLLPNNFMDKKISFLKKVKTNIYARTFFLSIGAIVLSYLIVILLVFIVDLTSYEILFFLILIFSFIFIYYLFQKKYIKWDFSKKHIIIPGLFLWLILFPFVNEVIDELTNALIDAWIHQLNNKLVNMKSWIN